MANHTGVGLQMALFINMVSTKVGGNIEKNTSARLLILPRRISWAVGLNSRLSQMANMALVFLLHSDFIKTLVILFVPWAFHDRLSGMANMIL